MKLQVNDFIYVTGGNTFFLLQELKKAGADKLIKEQISAGKIYIGESAGAMILSPNIEYVIPDPREPWFRSSRDASLRRAGERLDQAGGLSCTLFRCVDNFRIILVHLAYFHFFYITGVNLFFQPQQSRPQIFCFQQVAMMIYIVEFSSDY